MSRQRKRLWPSWRACRWVCQQGRQQLGLPPAQQGSRATPTRLLHDTAARAGSSQPGACLLGLGPCHAVMPAQPCTIAVCLPSAVQERYERHHRCVYSSEALAAAVALSSRYIADRHLPDKVCEGVLVRGWAFVWG